MDDTIFHAIAQSEPLPVDHEYSWRKARWVPQAWGVYGNGAGLQRAAYRGVAYTARLPAQL